ncbi:MAG: ABC transporter substrate-binding protein [Chloroflexota bacterium]|nr:ABC transporter substrate-binding protein [Chloroflexota bacterium]
MGGTIHQLSRRRFLVGATAAASAAILAACGGGGTATDTPAPTKPATAAAGAPTTAASSVTTATTVASAPAVAATPSAASAVAPSGPLSTVAAPSAVANAPKGGAITQATIGTDAKSFHPYLTTDTASGIYQGNVYGGGLIKYDDNTLDLIGDVAEKFTISPDRKTYTFALRDIKWSDGTPLTTDDYVWTYQQVIKPENKYPYLENFGDIVSFTATDPKTLVVTLKDAFVTGLITAGSSITPLPRHIWEKLDWSDPTKNPEINAPTVASGPWKLKEWKRDDHATFVANDLYWEGRPNIDTLTVRVFGTQALAYQALKSGEVDYAKPQAADHKEAASLPNVTVYDWFNANGTWSYIGLNLRRPALKDPVVRKAIAYATDRKGIIDGVIYGLGRPLSSPFPQSSWAYSSNVERYDFDVNKAQDLFKQAGYTLTGKKLMKDGQQLTLKMLYPSASKSAEGIATVMQQQLSDLGIALNVQSLEFQALQDTLKKDPFDYDLYIAAWSATLEPYYMYQIWSEQSIPELNAGAYVNKQVETLFEQSHREFDLEKRKTIFAQIQKLITDDAPYVFLYESQDYIGINKRIGGIVVGKLGPYDIHKWYVTK